MRLAPECVPQLFGRSSWVETSVRPPTFSVRHGREPRPELLLLRRIEVGEVHEIGRDDVGGEVPAERQAGAAVLRSDRSHDPVDRLEAVRLVLRAGVDERLGERRDVMARGHVSEIRHAGRSVGRGEQLRPGGPARGQGLDLRPARPDAFRGRRSQRRPPCYESHQRGNARNESPLQTATGSVLRVA